MKALSLSVIFGAMLLVVLTGCSIVPEVGGAGSGTKQTAEAARSELVLFLQAIKPAVDKWAVLRNEWNAWSWSNPFVSKTPAENNAKYDEFYGRWNAIYSEVDGITRYESCQAVQEMILEALRGHADVALLYREYATTRDPQTMAKAQEAIAQANKLKQDADDALSALQDRYRTSFSAIFGTATPTR